MNREEVNRLYDGEYARAYDDNFLLGGYFRECTEFEVGLIERLITPTSSWLDVGCGTGYFLSRFSSLLRCGLDLSTAMLERARRANPNIELVEGDFRVPRPKWNGKWDLVSCMWYAYCYVETVAEAEVVIRNMAGWTAAGGNLFLPVCDPDVLCKTAIPYNPPPDSDDGELRVSAIVWNWTDLPSGKRHNGLIAPHPKHLVQLLEQEFSQVDFLEYPSFEKDVLSARRAIVARHKVC